MKKLEVQEFLESKSFGDLAKAHGVYCSFSKCGSFFSLNYDQIEAKENDPLSQKCRGLILTANKSFLDNAEKINSKLVYDHIIPGETQILAYPMSRFFNMGQGAQADLDWKDPDLKAIEKLDGSLLICYFNTVKNCWCMATRAVPEANLLMDSGLFTFRTLFEKALEEKYKVSFDDFTSELNPNYTYCFELTSRLNRIVCDYPEMNVSLLAIRELETHKELDPKSTFKHSKLDISHPKEYDLNEIKDLADWVSTLSPLEHEGIVLKDSKFNRIKVKSPAYIAYNKLHDRLGTSSRNCLEMILLEKDDDIIPFISPYVADNLIEIKKNLNIFIKKYDELYLTIKAEADALSLGDKKTFAIMANAKDIWTAPMFHIYGGKSNSIKDFLIKSKKLGTWSDSFLDRLLELISNK